MSTRPVVLLMALLGACARAEAPAPPALSASSAPLDAGPAATASAQPSAPVIVPDAPVRSLAVMGTSTCAEHTDGSHTCWGGSHGPRPRRGVEPAKRGAGDDWHPCEVRPDHTIGCVRHSGGPIEPVSGVSDVVEIAGHPPELDRCSSMCARGSDGTVTCWGINEKGQLGRGTIAPTVEQRTKPSGRCIQPGQPPEKVKGLVDVEQIAGGDGFFCARLRSGKVACWGALAGQTIHPAPAIIDGLEGVDQIVAGPFHLCALTRDRRVRCIGRDLDGELGNGWALTDGPREVPGISDAASVYTNDTFSCAISRAGRVACWGDLEHGGRRRALPEELPLPGPAVQISGLNMPCALLANGELHCVKGGRFARSRAQPLTRVSIGYPHACAIANGRVLCADVPQYSAPQQWREPRGLDVGDAVDVSMGGAHTCVLRRDGSLECFGFVPGDPTRVDSERVAGIEDVKAIAAGGRHGCAIKGDGSTWCWGDIHDGDAYQGPFLVRPAQRPGLAAVAIAASPWSPGASCAVTTEGRITCWGWFGSRPRDVGEAITTAKDLSMTGHHACALLADGHVTCWGDDRYGATGTGDPDVKGSSATPVEVDVAHAPIGG